MINEYSIISDSDENAVFANLEKRAKCRAELSNSGVKRTLIAGACNARVRKAFSGDHHKQSSGRINFT